MGDPTARTGDATIPPRPSDSLGVDRLSLDRVLACRGWSSKSIALPNVRPAHAIMFLLFVLVLDGPAVAFDRVPQPGHHAVRQLWDRW